MADDSTKKKIRADEAGASSTEERSVATSTIIKPPNKDFEVFLNFRGPDSRDTVVSVLYNDLARAGFGVFYDDESIRPGDVISKELEEGIKKSKIYITIFSKDYAASKWCLRELRMIIDQSPESAKEEKQKEKEEKTEQKEKDKKLILPIFYDIEVSSELKLDEKESKYYVGALKKHESEQKVENDELEGWKQALKGAAIFKGWKVNEFGLTKLSEHIVEEVGRKLGIRFDPKKALDKYVGMRKRMDDVMDLLKLDDADRVRFVTIYGMPGMGKTALARLVFQELKLSSHFQGQAAAFLSSSGGTVDVVRLQKELIDKLCNVKPSDFVLAKEGVDWIKAKLSDKKVLIVLDDLDNEDQVSNLADDISWFGKGSRVIITTRNRGIVPRDAGFSNPYEMVEMAMNDALTLLCREAFKSDSPPEGYDGKSLEDAVEMTGKNPKAICALAAAFRRINKKEQRSDLLENIMKGGINDVNEMLMISYEKLDQKYREIFLDIACLFINKEKNDAFYYWEAQGRCPELGIMVLENFSLIETVDRNKICMNRLLSDFGRNIVDGKDIDNPEMRSRLWSPEVALKVVSEKKGTANVVALNVGKPERQPDFDYEQFKGFTKLKYLELNGGYFKTEDFKEVFSELRWFSWDNCQPKFRTIHCCFRKLVVLLISKTQIKDYWAGWHEIEEAKDLKVLKCTDCYSLTKSPDFSAFIKLERLVFTNCPRLTEIDQSIGKLKSLSVLELELENLTELPDSIKVLVKLMHLCLRCSKLEKLPEWVGDLRKLVVLDISRTKITTLPEPVMNLIRSLNVVFKHEGCGLNENVLAGLRS